MHGSGLHTTHCVCCIANIAVEYAQGIAYMLVRMLHALQVHLVDSFAGLPSATQTKDVDSWSKMKYVAVPLQEVRSNFVAYELDDEQQVRITFDALRHCMKCVNIEDYLMDVKLYVYKYVAYYIHVILYIHVASPLTCMYDYLPRSLSCCCTFCALHGALW